eukprot:TRINITY_DN4252_c2_g1_i1.p1 TRINITY_DN4252_c2_g1~~TRINITY_DN4252_c2_g1_i1.p1  ORF type:complete len:348 (+),score=65.12 TRINITY_DN4252_c2_g1_i1:91-1134(+)
MKVRGNPSIGRASTGTVSMLLLVWGLLWVLYVTSYGVCSGDLEEVKRLTKDRELDTMRRTMEESENMYAISSHAQELAEELRGCRNEIDIDKIAVVVPCSSDFIPSLTASKSAPNFHIYAVTDPSAMGTCAEILKTVKIDNPRAKISSYSTHASHEGEAALLSDAVSELTQTHEYQHYAVIENHVYISEDGLQLLTAAAEQDMFHRRTDLLVFSLGLDESDPSDPIRHHVTPEVFSVVVRDNLVPGGAFITSKGHWPAVSHAITESSPILGAAPLLPRASHQHIHKEGLSSNVVPVFFPALSLEYLGSKHQYEEWLAARNQFPGETPATKITLSKPDEKGVHGVEFH